MNQWTRRAILNCARGDGREKRASCCSDTAPASRTGACIIPRGVILEGARDAAGRGKSQRDGPQARPPTRSRRFASQGEKREMCQQRQEPTKMRWTKYATSFLGGNLWQTPWSGRAGIWRSSSTRAVRVPKSGNQVKAFGHYFCKTCRDMLIAAARRCAPCLNRRVTSPFSRGRQP
jgi:hypothetical protein